MSYEQFKNFEKRGSQELEPKEKENLVDAWLKIAVDNQLKPENVESLSNEELKEWLYKTLMVDIEALVIGWGLEPDPILIEGIKNEQDLEQRAKLEMKYLEDTRAKINDFHKANPLAQGQSDKYVSWPSEMRKKKSFNCVGGTLLGMSLLERVDISSFCGKPSSHVLNIARLSNGEWVYADFTNNQVKIVKPEEGMLDGVRILELKEPDIIYRCIPLLDNRDVPDSIIGNFHSLEHDVKDEKADPTDKNEAKRLFTIFNEEFKKNDFSRLHDALYPSQVALQRTKEIQNEDRRVEKIHSLLATLREYTKEYTRNLSPSQRKKLLEEIKENSKEIRELFYKDDRKVLDKITPELKKTLQLIVRSTKSVKKKNPELYSDFVELLVSR